MLHQIKVEKETDKQKINAQETKKKACPQDGSD